MLVLLFEFEELFAVVVSSVDDSASFELFSLLFEFELELELEVEFEFELELELESVVVEAVFECIVQRVDSLSAVIE